MKCCKYDADEDGNCHIHTAPGVFRVKQFNAHPPFKVGQHVILGHHNHGVVREAWLSGRRWFFNVDLPPAPGTFSLTQHAGSVIEEHMRAETTEEQAERERQEAIWKQ